MSRSFAAVALTLLAMPGLVQAAVGVGEVAVPAGQVACINLKYAKDYASYSAKAPEFAADLIDKAACFKVDEPLTGVPQKGAEGFDKVKLLTGHTIWVPATAPAVAR